MTNAYESNPRSTFRGGRARGSRLSGFAFAFLISLFAAESALATTTVFGPGGTIGALVPDSEVLNGIDAFANFGVDNGSSELLSGTPNAGETLFFANTIYYIGNAGGPSSDGTIVSGNNRAYGVIGTGRSDITFLPETVSALTLQARGTINGTSTGGAGSVSPGIGGPGAALADANATLLVYSNLGLEISQSISNAAFETLTVDVSALAGDSIARISLINQGPANSAFVLGELTVVPEPGTALLMGMGLILLASSGGNRDESSLN